jgi:hypothetical protein
VTLDGPVTGMTKAFRVVSARRSMAEPILRESVFQIGVSGALSIVDNLPAKEAAKNGETFVIVNWELKDYHLNPA